MDAEARQDALGHLEQCSPCRSALADEQALQAGLRALSAADESSEAPERVEAALLGAFRQHQSSRDAAVLSFASRRPWALAAAAAAALIISAYALWSAVSRPVPATPDKTAAKTTATPDLVKKIEERTDLPAPPIKQEPAQGRAQRLPAGREMASSKSPSTQAGKYFIEDQITAYADDQEVTSEFIPIDQEQKLTLIENGQVIRVQMPRSALARFGAPVSGERADVPVIADLLVGEDGIARAIRFVRYL